MALFQNGLRNRQVAGVGDFQIVILRWHDHYASARMFNRGNFIGNDQRIPTDTFVRLKQRRSPKNLWRLHRENILPIDRAADDLICVGKLERVRDRRRQNCGAMFPRRRKDALDFAGRNQRARGIVHRHKLRIFG